MNIYLVTHTSFGDAHTIQAESAQSAIDTYLIGSGYRASKIIKDSPTCEIQAYDVTEPAATLLLVAT